MELKIFIALHPPGLGGPGVSGREDGGSVLLVSERGVDISNIVPSFLGNNDLDD